MRAVSVHTRADLQAKRGKRIVVTSETECVVCGRRIGNAAFAWLASGRFAHVGCPTSYGGAVGISRSRAGEMAVR